MQMSKRLDINPGCMWIEMLTENMRPNDETQILILYYPCAFIYQALIGCLMYDSCEQQSRLYLEGPATQAPVKSDTEHEFSYTETADTCAPYRETEGEGWDKDTEKEIFSRCTVLICVPSLIAEPSFHCS